MNAAAKTPDHGPTTASPIQTTWPETLSGKEWDARYPGMLDAVAIMGGAANVIMQLANRPVSYGVMESRVDSGNLFKHPIKRSRTTLTYLTVALMGTPEEKLAYRQAVNRSHAKVRSTADSPVQYNAFDPSLQLWVAAAIYWGYSDARSKLRGPLSPQQAAAFYQHARPIGTTLQVRDDMWPADLAAFDAYWQNGLKQLHLDDRSRAHLLAIVDLKFLHPVLRKTFGPFNRFVTTGFLPPEMREQMQLAWSHDQQDKFERLMRLIGRVNSAFPRSIRQLPFTLLLWDFRRRLKSGQSLV